MDGAKVRALFQSLSQQALLSFESVEATEEEAYAALASVAAYVVATTSKDAMEGFHQFMGYFAKVYGKATSVNIELCNLNETKSIRFEYEPKNG